MLTLSILLLSCVEFEGKYAIDDDGDGYTEFEEDCNDQDSRVNPGESEICDAVDNNCNGEVDEGAVDGIWWYPDEDEDGFGRTEDGVNSCAPDDGFVSKEGDCRDNDPFINPAAHEICDEEGVDENCNGVVNEAEESGVDTIGASVFYFDQDDDGFGDATQGLQLCSAIGGYVDNKLDCDDADALTNPDGIEICDEKDNDCDDSDEYDGIDENFASDAYMYYLDGDGDGFGYLFEEAEEEIRTWNEEEYRNEEGQYQYMLSCKVTPPTGYSASSDDCDDDLIYIYPGAIEYCNEVDEDCDGETFDDESANAPTFYLDTDGDGYGGGENLSNGTSETEYTKRACEIPEGYSSSALDCDDSNPLIFPSAPEVCDSLDNNCDDLIDGEDSVNKNTYYLDGDGDGYGNPSYPTFSCTDVVGYVGNDEDCNDGDILLNQSDEDGDGFTTCEDDCNDTDASKNLQDLDGDGFTTCDNDCNDGNPLIYPEADEECDGIDNNCDDLIDGEDSIDQPMWYLDNDEDGFGANTGSELSCTVPEGFVGDNTDCDDSDVNQNPEADELCSTEEDDNCDGVINENTATDVYLYYQDADSDGYGVELYTTGACTLPAGYAEQQGDDWDCNDNDSLARPGLTEYCNDKDDDCDGLVDELFSEDAISPAQDTVSFYIDEDGDGFGALGSEETSFACPNELDDLGSLVADNNEDCDDDNPEIHPEAEEVCDETVDMNCDGDFTLGAINPVTWYVDSDKDTFGDPEVFFRSCTSPVGFVEDDTDCNDLDSEAFPEAVEVCNGKRDNCSGNPEVVEEAWFAEDQVDFEAGIDVVVRQIPLDEWDHDGDDWVDCIPVVSAQAWGSSQKQLVDGDGVYQSGLLGGKDCDDTRDFVYPAAPETCNGQHDDCEEQEDVGGIPADEGDIDNDGFVACERTDPLPLNELGEPDWFGTDPNIYLELTVEGYFPIGGDCRDSDEYTYPGAAYLTSETDCLRDASGTGGVGMPDGYSDCVFTQCDYGVFLSETVGPDFVLIEGDDLIDPSNRYTIPHPFYMMTTLVTNGMYNELMSVSSGDNKPKNYISWYEAVAYANALSENQGFEMCYTCEETNNVEPCVASVTFTDYYECEGYTLPSEHEWELAARSGTTKDFWTGEGDDLGGNYSSSSCEGTETINDGVNNPLLGDYGWYCGNNSPSGTKEVAQKLPNGFGLYDMHGNVWEWNHDPYGCTFPVSNAVPCVQDSSDRVQRGGRYSSGPASLRSSYRGNTSASRSNYTVGFRLRKKSP